MIAVISLVAAVAVVLLVIEDCSRREWKRAYRTERQWNHEHYRGAGSGDYELARTDDTRRTATWLTN